MFLKKLFLIITLSLLINVNLSKAENSIYFIDMDLIMNKSLAGKSVLDQVKNINQNNLENFKKIENEIKNEEAKIVSQKNVLDKNDYQKKVISLREKISNYQKNKNKKLKELKKSKILAQAELINNLTPILAEVSEKRSISIIIPKENIIMGKTELDLTNEVMTLLDKKIKKIKLK